MASLNKPNTYGEKTHEGATASRMTPLQALRRSVLSCLLWEDTFYEDGEDIATRIGNLTVACAPSDVTNLAKEARSSFNLRHVPLLLLSYLGHNHRLKASSVVDVIQRADELTELLAIHAKINGVGPDKLKGKIPSQMKKGLAEAFKKFDAYALGKYNRDGAIKLRDVLFLTHPKPKDEAQQKLWEKLIDGTLESPDTWEVALSRGADKKETFERLIKEGKLGYLALLRNLRNMIQSGCDTSLVKEAILLGKGGVEKVLPFRFVAAARHAPQFERELDQMLCKSVSYLPMLRGETIVLVDVSGSMNTVMSGKSDMTRIDAACALASVVNAESLRVFSFSSNFVECPPRKGMAGVDAIRSSQPHSSTDLGLAIKEINKLKHDRLIVITDEQSQSRVDRPLTSKAYLINVAPYKNGIGYGGGWTHIDGFSEQIFRYISESER